MAAEAVEREEECGRYEVEAERHAASLEGEEAAQTREREQNEVLRSQRADRDRPPRPRYML